MRVCNQVYVLRGPRRAALHDDVSKVCHPLGTLEEKILRILSDGHLPGAKELGVENSVMWKAMTDMRRRGWIEAGSPVIRSLDPPILSGSETFIEPKEFRHVWLELTDSCNLRCLHCYAESGPEQSRSGELSVDQWIEIVDGFLARGTAQFTFIGGEPTIRMDIVEKVTKHIRRKSPDLVICLFSNLLSVHSLPSMIRFLKQWRVQVGTSLYGATAEEHDQVTGKPGSWKKTTGHIRSLLDEEIRVFVGIYADLSDRQKQKKDALETWARDFGLEHFDVVASSPVGRGEALSWEAPHHANTLPSPMSYSFTNWERGGTYHNCFYDHLAIGAQGQVMSCIMQREQDIGNIAEVGISGVLASESFRRKALLGKNAIEGCSECEFRYACFDCRPSVVGTITAKPDCGYDPRLNLGVRLQ